MEFTRRFVCLCLSPLLSEPPDAIVRRKSNEYLVEQNTKGVINFLVFILFPLKANPEKIRGEMVEENIKVVCPVLLE